MNLGQAAPIKDKKAKYNAKTKFWMSKQSQITKIIWKTNFISFAKHFSLPGAETVQDKHVGGQMEQTEK